MSKIIEFLSGPKRVLFTLALSFLFKLSKIVLYLLYSFFAIFSTSPNILSFLFLSVFISLTNVFKGFRFYIFFLRVTYTIVIILEIIFYLENHSSVVSFSGSLINSSMFFNIAGFYTEPFSFFFDKISLIFSIVTLIIGFFAMGFVIFYLAGDKNIVFFIKFLNLFILSMLFLVKTDSLLMVVFCWEFLGISSFFLIGFYHNKPYVLKSSLKAFFFNRISDLFLFIFFVLYIYEYGVTTVSMVRSTGSSIEYLLLFSLLQLSFVKSAQGIYYFWLPDSMEAPIPASALIHSATLVSAGIYLCLRYRYLLLSNIHLKNFLLYHSLFCAVTFSFIAFLQYDIKKLLAFSTISNCSFMYFLISLGFLDETLFYFTLHGFLKSLLFLFVGYFIILNSHSQDIRDWSLSKKDNNLFSLLPILLLSLGGLNLSLSFDIKHSIHNIYGNGIFFYLVLFMFWVYSLNSMLYALKFIIVKFLDVRVHKSLHRESVGVPFFIVLPFVYITVLSLLCLFFYSNITILNFPNTSQSSLMSLGSFTLPLLFFFFFKNNNLIFLGFIIFLLFSILF